MGIQHAKGKGTVFPHGDFRFAMIKQVFTVMPVAVIHAVFDSVPAQTTWVLQRYLDDRAVAAVPAARRGQDNPIRRNFFLGDFRLCQGSRTETCQQNRC